MNGATWLVLGLVLALCALALRTLFKGRGGCGCGCRGCTENCRKGGHENADKP